jgi:hypothetical protein
MNIASIFCHLSITDASFLGSGEQRQAYFKERAGSNLALHAYLATVGLDNPLHNRQAQPAAAGLSVPYSPTKPGPGE